MGTLEQFKRLLDFYATAVTEEFKRSRGYKVVTYLSALSALLTYVGLFITLQFPKQPWQVWAVAAALATILFLLFIFVAVYRYHVRTVEELNAGYVNEIAELTSNRDEEARQLVSGHQEEITNLRSQVDIQARNHVRDAEALKEKIRTLEIQIEERDRYKLTLEVDTNDQSQVMVKYPYRQEGFEMWEFCSVNPDLKIRFVNHDVYPVSVLGLSISLIRLDEHGEETELQLDRYHSKAHQLPDMTEVDFLPLKVEGGTVTPYYWLRSYLHTTDYTEKISPKYFLRVTMKATRQPPYPVDLFADWKEAQKGTVNLYSRNFGSIPNS